VEPLLGLLESGPWEGSPGELLKAVSLGSDESARGLRGWPTNARGMRSALDRAAPNLRAIGVEIVNLARTGHRRPVRIIRVANQPSQPSRPSLDLLTSDGIPLGPRALGDGHDDGRAEIVAVDGARPSLARQQLGKVSDGRDGRDGQRQTFTDTVGAVAGTQDTSGTCAEIPHDPLATHLERTTGQVRGEEAP
jgi:hypothetical protein